MEDPLDESVNREHAVWIWMILQSAIHFLFDAFNIMCGCRSFVSHCTTLLCFFPIGSVHLPSGRSECFLYLGGPSHTWSVVCTKNEPREYRYLPMRQSRTDLPEDMRISLFVDLRSNLIIQSTLFAYKKVEKGRSFRPMGVSVVFPAFASEPNPRTT